MALSGSLLIILGIFLQSVGKVVYAAYLQSIPTTTFVFLSFLIAVVVFKAICRTTPPARKYSLLIQNNIFTASAFLCFFFALKYLEPAIVGSLEIGVSLITAMVIAGVKERILPPIRRIVICMGILGGCALLIMAAIRGGTGFQADIPLWIPVTASIACGSFSALTVINCKQLLAAGWSSLAILAHRFYLIIFLGLIIAWWNHDPLWPQESEVLFVFLIVAIIGIVVPLLLLQAGLERCDPLTALVTLACQPTLTFLLAGFSPAYEWSRPTLIAVAVLTVFVLLDMLSTQRSTGANGLGGRLHSRTN